jgi:hypothetical protein
MSTENRGNTPSPIWTYGYEILPPFPLEGLRSLEALLEEEHLMAKDDARVWVGRFLVEEQATHLLVVSDSPDQKRAVNVRLEAELRRITAAFSITTPFEVSDPEQGSLFGDRGAGPIN